MSSSKYVLIAVLFFGAVMNWTLPAAGEVPVDAGEFLQQLHKAYTGDDGLPAQAVLVIDIGADGAVYAKTEAGVAVFDGKRWAPVGDDAGGLPFEPLPWYPTLEPLIGSRTAVRDVAKHAGEIAVAAASGLYVGDGAQWDLALPIQGDVRWAPVDVRAVTYDAQGRLWFAAPQGVGCRVAENDWRLFTGADGLPYNDFTCIAAGSTGIWFGTVNGAIQYHDGQWAFRQGRRWLLDNHVRDIVVDGAGDAWIATSAGVSRIEHRGMTLDGKASFYEDEIEKYHRRTRFGYVNPADLTAPGDKTTAVPVYSDNDGFNTGLYLGAMSFAYAVSGEGKYRRYAENAFRALAFLSEVTQGGPHGAPKGFIARNVVPTSEPDPNERYDRDYDIGRKERDSLWKIMEPRVPVDGSGQWYWKCDSSSDELDGHFFGCAIYFDRVCDTETKKDDVRDVVRRIIDHLLAHDYSLVDHDGLPTRWGHFAPDDLNRNEAWCEERGLNSYSILAYLSIAHHITGDPKYHEAYLELALDQGYGMNGMVQPKALPGPNSPGHQPDDNMAFVNYYHLIRYETDPKLLRMYQYAMRVHWQYEKLERNAFTNFVYGACSLGEKLRSQWGEVELSPPMACFEDAVDTLRRYPLDLVEWPMSNAHRTDLKPLGGHSDGEPTSGGRIDGYAFPIDERHETYWDWDPWALTSSGSGLRLRSGFHYLLAYYMGRFHGFIGE